MDAVKFLQRFKKDGPWVLTAISTDKKSLYTQTFGADKTDKMQAWIQAQNKQNNVYFNVNPTLRPMTKKPGRADIASLEWLHVDIDPRAAGDLETDEERREYLNRERARIEKVLKNPPEGIPKPTLIIFSGGGCQGFWRLKEGEEIKGSVTKAEELKLYNLQLEQLFDADPCHNIDRIMRLPGTTNWPDQKKIKKGRLPTPAVVVEFNDSEYSLSDFNKAPLVQNTDIGFAGGMVTVSDNVPRIDSMADLPHSVGDWAKVLIVQGKDPDDPYKYESRSDALFAVCCELVRADLNDDTIYSIITDPDWAISESVLDKGAGIKRYALRQIERAREYAIDPALQELNQKHAVVADMGGRCKVVSEVNSEIPGRTRISTQSFEDFRNRYMHRQVEIGTNKEGQTIYMPLGKWWLQNRHRRQYETMVFSPGGAPPDVYNLWKGFAYQPRHGDCSEYLDHIKQNICQGNQEHYDYLIKWMATAIQKPDAPGHTAIVLRGKRGTGKGSFVKHFGALFGRHFLQIVDSKHITGNFNVHLRDCVLLFADEAFYAGDKKQESVLKAIVTEEMLVYEKKGVDADIGPNYTHLVMASNDDWVVPAGTDERRFFVLDVGEENQKDIAYFKRIAEGLKNGGYEALLDYLMNLDISEFNVRSAPETAALLEQKQLSFSIEERWWYDILQEGIISNVHDHWQEEALKEGIYTNFMMFQREANVRYPKSKSAMGKFLTKALPKGYPRTVQRRGISSSEWMLKTGNKLKPPARPHYYELPPLDQCRKHFDKVFGGPYSWNTEVIEELPNKQDEIL